MIQLRTVAVLVLLAVAFIALFPPPHHDLRAIYWGDVDKVNNKPDSVGEMRESAAHIDRRLAEGEHVYGVLAEYYALSDHYPPYSPRIYNLVSKQIGKIEGMNQTGLHDRRRDQFTADLRGGKLQLLVMTVRLDFMLSEWPKARAAFRANYCRVTPTPDVFQQNNARLYEYAPGRSHCINRTEFDTGN